MISFDLECNNGHKFEGIFKDYQSFDEQLNKGIISCPICNDAEIKRLFTGCSIQSRSSSNLPSNEKSPTMFEFLRMVQDYVKNNFDNVGREFADTAKAIYYGIEEERNIYGESTIEEINELAEEGINVLPIPEIDKIEN